MTVEGNPPSQRTAWSGADYAIFTATGLIASEGENFYSAVLTDPFERAETNIVSVVARGKGYQYDMRGNLTNDSEFAYGFNDENRLVSVARLSDTTLVMTCVYDATGRRREKVTYLDGGITNRYAYGASGLEWAVLAISDGADGLLEEYVHGPDLSGGFAGAGGIGGILSFRTWGGASVEEVGFLHYDGNGNMVSVSDDDESLLAKYEYSPFGMVLNHAGSFDSRYQFSSKEFDENVRMNYYGYRSYLSSAARWLNRDPLLEGGGVNLYRFNMGNPITRLDYLGLESCDPFTAEPRTWIDEDSCKISGGIFTGESSVETIGSPPRKAICKCEKIGAEKHCDQVTEDCMCVGTEYEGNTVIGIFEWIETERNQILLQEGLKAWVELLRIELSPSMHYWKFEALCKQACGNLKGQ